MILACVAQLSSQYEDDSHYLQYQNNWLGEVGGVACLLFFLLRLVMAVVDYVLKLSDNFAVTDMGKYRNEGFNNY